MWTIHPGKKKEEEIKKMDYARNKLTKVGELSM